MLTPYLPTPLICRGHSRVAACNPFPRRNHVIRPSLELAFRERAMPKNDELRYGAPRDSAVHLCVDMQRMFAESTGWRLPWLERVLPNIASITSAHPEK